ncbi:hypothetical protein [Cognatilysobacter lacus]|uniref:DUF998 domain-containing protein n=1 Tax=Cognatilysobacter lacus TaxID=1643323 RepID=A0A5D8YNN0_9GAMM|nr:hypothetical protein [Lysobacter lacus]TZF83443.1 hypothetical protein FW784_12970 [Lysobacter lacus]
MDRSLFVRILIAIFSAGWLLPLTFGVDTYLSFWQVEGWPLLREQHPLNSAPFFGIAATSFRIAFAWLAAVIAFWSYLAYGLWCRRTAA